jgi:6-phosphogluconolactonase
MISRYLLTGLIPKDRVIPVPVHLENPREAADAYAAELRRIFRVPVGFWPRFDLTLLGLGEDGHTASLFPGSPALKEEARWVVSLRRETEDFHRISLTFPIINRARRIVILVSGKEKAAILRKVLLGPRNIDRFPTQGIRPVDGTVQWLVDQEAASLLSVESLQAAGFTVRPMSGLERQRKTS